MFLQLISPNGKNEKIIEMFSMFFLFFRFHVCVVIQMSMSTRFNLNKCVCVFQAFYKQLLSESLASMCECMYLFRWVYDYKIDVVFM